MSKLSLSAFEWRLADLTHEEFQDFVADLWTARGIDVSVDGDDLLVSTGFGQRTQRLRVITSDGPFLIDRAMPDSATDLEEVEMVVANVDSDWLRDVTIGCDIDYIGPERLRRIALYAIDRTQCEEIFQGHFGRPVAERGYRETGARRVQWIVDTLGPEIQRLEDNLNSSNGQASMSWVAASAGLMSILLIISIIVGTACSSHSVLHGGGQPTETAQFQNPAAMNAATYPPGLDATGIDNLTALVTAHQASLTNRSYNYHLSHRHSRSILLSSGRYHRARQLVRVGIHYRRYTIEGSLPGASIGTRPRPFTGTVINTAADCSVQFHNASRLAVDRDRLCRRLSPDNDTDPLATLTGRYAIRYLDESGRISRHFEQNGRTYYRVVSTASPENIPDAGTDYRTTATIAESGLIVNLSVTFRPQRYRGTTQSKVSFRFTRVGNRSVP